ncbi:M3 family oligoendopeptidase [Salisaeta longa]|uniref:M3 family oligoendopeptidase n=1 Tax=Salisaeta longa TaxID=503170 RepID=UPI0003B4F912|nr:M3 family oligoendopeptidase [Salisaeta longa]
MEQTATGAEHVRWDLSDLHASPDTLDDTLATLAEEAAAFAERYHGQIAALDAPALAEALATVADLQDRIGRAYAYAYLHWSTDTNDPARGALLQKTRERYTQIHKQLLFVNVEWAAIDEAVAHERLQHDALAPYRHYLALEQAHKAHILSEPEEKILSEMQVTGRSAWARFFDETVGALRFSMDGETLTQQEILSKLYTADRDVRRRAAAAFTEGLTEELRTFTFVFNTVLADKAATDRLRGYDHWMQSRNEANEVDDATVDALITAVTERYDLVGRFYRLKRRLLDLDTLYDYDRYAPVAAADTRYDWSDAQDVVLRAYADFHPDMADVARRFFAEDWIDAAVGEGKRSGAFSHGTVPSAHPYVLMNYTGRPRDVQTLAHELGHGVHQFLSREQTIFHHGTPLTTAETASVFGEMLVFQRLLAQEEDPGNRLALLVSKIDDTLATVFRQVAMNRFEARIHTARRTEGELSTDALDAAWLETQTAMFDGAVTLTDDYRHWWSYIPHFIHTPGYVYAYAFGELLVLALYERYRHAGDAFADRYLDVLRAGGSDWPHRLMAPLGVDLTAVDFWQRGLTAIEDLIGRAEALADRDASPTDAAPHA